MPHATSVTPGRVFLDWRRARIGPLAPCVHLRGARAVPVPAKNQPCHKGCAETWITTRATSAADLARLIRAHTPHGGGR